MIAKAFEDFLLSHLDHYLIPADDLAIFIDSHNADHVILLLVNNGYSRVPVITKDKHYLGTIAIGDIIAYQAKHDLTEAELAQTDIGLMVDQEMPCVAETANLTEIMHKLVDAPFLPVLDQENVFKGIITRKSILKAVNALLHNFTDDYDLIPKSVN